MAQRLAKDNQVMDGNIDDGHIWIHALRYPIAKTHLGLDSAPFTVRSIERLSIKRLIDYSYPYALWHSVRAGEWKCIFNKSWTVYPLAGFTIKSQANT